MTPYRLYVLNEEGHIFAPAIELECQSDHAAMTIAPTFLRHHAAVEVWSGERLVGRIKAETAPREGATEFHTDHPAQTSAEPPSGASALA